MQIGNNILICPFCGQLTKVIWVHGHGQCMVCKMNFDECCRGESVDDSINTNQNENEQTTDNNTSHNDNKQHEK